MARFGYHLKYTRRHGRLLFKYGSGFTDLGHNVMSMSGTLDNRCARFNIMIPSHEQKSHRDLFLSWKSIESFENMQTTENVLSDMVNRWLFDAI